MYLHEPGEIAQASDPALSPPRVKVHESALLWDVNLPGSPTLMLVLGLGALQFLYGLLFGIIKGISAIEVAPGWSMCQEVIY